MNIHRTLVRSICALGVVATKGMSPRPVTREQVQVSTFDGGCDCVRHSEEFTDVFASVLSACKRGDMQMAMLVLDPCDDELLKAVVADMAELARAAVEAEG